MATFNQRPLASPAALPFVARPVSVPGCNNPLRKARAVNGLSQKLLSKLSNWTAINSADEKLPRVYQVALCGISAHKAHLIQVVVKCTESPFGYQFDSSELLECADIALVNLGERASILQLKRLREKSPKVVAVYISEHGMACDTRFRLAANSLMAGVCRTLDVVVSMEIHACVDQPENDFSEPEQRSQANPPQRPLPNSPNLAILPSASARKLLSRPTPQAKPRARLTALVVDASALARAQTRAELRKIGIDCCEAADAEQALSLLSQPQSRFDLAVLDIVMDGLDGIQLCRKIKRDPRLAKLTTIIFTRRSSEFDRTPAALAGCDSYLTKPLNRETFVSTIEGCLERSRKGEMIDYVGVGYAVAMASQ